MDRMSSGNPGALMTKWSIKPADSRSTRVRNNQRRHREKVKSRIEHLESKLAETELQLQQALATVQRLTAELENTRTSASARLTNDATVNNTCPSPPRPESSVRSLPLRSPSAQQQTSAHFFRAVEPGGNNLVTRVAGGTYAKAREQHDAAPTWQRRSSDSDRLLMPTAHLHHPLVACTSSCDTWGSYDAAVGDDEKKYDTMEPPQPKESTTRCRDAYRLIAEKNYAKVDVSLVRGWLESGFRGPVAKGDGCRVENRLLFEVLDHITS
ncbi:hypothetical protein ACO1O0_007119 [Amphichorda felina]